MQSFAQVIQPELLWTESGWRRGWQIEVDSAGRVAAMGPARPSQGGAPAARSLPGRALLPGFVNAHSHAFQRALRGFGETYPAGAGDFWTWREAMYGLVERITPESFARVCRWTFREMLAAGFTTVAEFHYLHHADASARDFALDEILLEAARDAGIRLVVLACYYRTGGIGQPLGPAQRRFDGGSPDEFLRQVDRLAARLDPASQSIGLAPHSIRAVPPDALRTLVQESHRRGWPCHMHVEEQPREIEECAAAYGSSPMRWLLENGLAGPNFTAVHCTHTPREDLLAFAASGARLCACPITEGSLGDGISQAASLFPRGREDHTPANSIAARPPVCIGTDSNIRIDPFEELRWLESAQRLRTGRRGLLAMEGGAIDRQLLACGTQAGAAALGLPTGALAEGRLCDLITIDLGHMALEGWTEETLLASLLLGAGCDVVRDVCVGGVWIPKSTDRP